jgi:hypothetical protein
MSNDQKKRTPKERLELLRRLFVERTAQMYGDDDSVGLKLYSRMEWHEKGEDEQSGEGAVLTVFIGDSRWCDALAGYGSVEEEGRANKALEKLTTPLQFDWDMGGDDLLHFWFCKGTER